MNKDFIYVDTLDCLKNAAKHWEKAKELGIDLECENNLHHYGVYISLIQISDKNHNWLVDCLRLKDLSPLIRVFKNPNIQKIFHDVGFDIRIIKKQLGVVPKNIFDTLFAAFLLGKDKLNLGDLLEHYFNIKKEKKFQMADWTKRPLTDAMLEYAVKDSMYLINLRDALKKELIKKNRLSWAIQEFETIEHKDFETKERTYKNFRGFKELSSIEKGRLKQLFLLRERLAKKVNRPVHFIMNGKKLSLLVKHPPKNEAYFKFIKGVHPIVRKSAHDFFIALKKTQPEKRVIVKVKRKSYSNKQRILVHELNELRGRIAEKEGIKKNFILSKEQIQEIVINNNLKSLRNWQKLLLEKHGIRNLMGKK